MPTIHMETEQVRSIARQLERTADQIQSEVEQVAQRVRGIPWQSPARESYIADMEALRRKIQATAQQALVLSTRVQREVNEWEQVAASFGAVGARVANRMSAGSPVSPPAERHKKPENMRLLAELVMDGSDPIRIYEIGPNEYLVVIQGTDANNPNASNNWGSAVSTGLGLSSNFQDQVRLALLGLPAGAIVHMAGHSQGGIVAQNLAGDRQVAKRVNVNSVTTFGSPYSAKEVDGVNYNRYAAEGDVVPYLEGRDLLTTILLTPFIGGPKAALVTLTNRYSQTTIPGNFSDGIFAPHFEYSKSPALEKISGSGMPFEIKAWDGQPTVYDPGKANSGAAVFYKNLVSGVEQVGKTAKSTVDAAGNIVKQTGNFFGNLF